MGLIIYSNLYDCDPFTAGLVKKLDQIVPYFVMRIGDKIPGLPGLFIAGLFSGGLSSMSGLLNVLSCIIYDDFLRDRYSTFKSLLNIVNFNYDNDFLYRLQKSSQKTISTVLKVWPSQLRQNKNYIKIFSFHC